VPSGLYKIISVLLLMSPLTVLFTVFYMCNIMNLESIVVGVLCCHIFVHFTYAVVGIYHCAILSSIVSLFL